MLSSNIVEDKRSTSTLKRHLNQQACNLGGKIYEEEDCRTLKKSSRPWSSTTAIGSLSRGITRLTRGNRTSYPRQWAPSGFREENLRFK